MSTLTKIWKPSDDLKGYALDDFNGGDLIGKFIMEQLGFPAKILSEATQQEKDEAEFVFVPGSTSFGSAPVLAGKRTVYWGSGIGASVGYDIRKFPDDTILSLRGPVSARMLLNFSVPQGDIAGLLPQFLPNDDSTNGLHIYIPHLSHPEPTEQFLDDHLIDKVVSTVIKESAFEGWVAEIASAKSAVVGSLHGAAICAAYGVPFYFAAPKGAKWQYPIKYLDFTESINIPFLPQNDYRTGIEWAEGIAERLTLPDMAPVLAAFPAL